MTDTATSRYGARQQSQGSNTNTWGDDKLNEVLRLLDRGSKGYQSIALTGDQTLSWSNYVATNTGQCAVLVLTGSLSAVAALTVPSVEWQWDLIKNATGQTVTVKTAAGSGVAIAHGQYMSVYCDGADCYNGSPTNLPGAVTVAGKISGVTAGTAATDAVNKTQMETAIATAALPATAGTVLNSSSDTTAGYLGQKITEGTGIDIAVQNSGGNENIQISVDTSELPEILANTGTLTGTFTGGINVMAARRRYRITGGTATLPTLTAADNFAILEMSPAAGTTVTAGRNSQSINGTSADRTWTGSGLTGPVLLFTFVSAGAIRMEIVGSTAI
ncbi:MAG: hypothetical protein K2P94_18030 [Rhodospirillaceae bacterium]|nr:hypothetical protein [Rhodospirillaceae bacterium]